MKISEKFFLVLFVFVKIVSSKPVAESSDQIIIRDDNEIDSNDEMIMSEVAKKYDGEENAKLFQGDIILQPEQREILLSNDTDDSSKRTSLLLEYMRWPKNALGKVVVPFVIEKTNYSEKIVT
jgi:hypothetical protein